MMSFTYNNENKIINVLKNNFSIKYNNELSNGVDNYYSNLIVHGYTLDESKQLIFNDALKNTSNNFETKFAIENSSIEYKNNIYLLNLPNHTYTKKIKLSCNTNHSKLILNCNYQHPHTRGCMKSYFYDCNTGCNFEYKTVTNKYSYSINEFNDFFDSNYLSFDEVNFNYLIKFDNNNSHKFFDRNIINFKFNYDYLNSLILTSYNKYLVTIIKNDYINKFDKGFLDKIIELILDNKITNFDSQIIKKIEINKLNFSYKNNLKYWFEMYKYESVENIINDLNKINSSIYKNQYLLNELNVSEMTWKKLENIFFDENVLKNTFFEIKYNTKLNNSHPPKIISLYNLMNGIDTTIIYNFNNFNIDGFDFDDEAIYITQINLYTNSNLSTFKTNMFNLGFYYFDNNSNSETIVNPNLIDEKSWFKFNENLNYKKIFLVNNINYEESQQFLISNNLYDLPNNINKLNLINLVTNLKLSPYISLIDKSILDSINDNNANLLSDYFKKFIRNINVINSDLNGTSKLIIDFNNNEKIIFIIKGFKTKEIDAFIKSNQVNLSNLFLKNLFEIDNDFIFNKLISFENNKTNLANIFINCYIDDFIENSFVDIEKTISNNKMNVSIFYIDKFNKKSKLDFEIIDDIKNNSDNNDISNISKPIDYESNNDFKLLIILSIIFLSIAITILIIIIAIKKYKKEKGKKYKKD